MNDDQLHDADLRQLARSLGASAADRLDVERTAAAVLQRLRTESRVGRSTPSWWRRPRWLLAAAAALLIVGGVLLLRRTTGSGHVAHYVAEDLRDLSTDQLREVLGTLDQTLTEPTTIDPSDDDLNGLTTEQLERLLESLEG